MKTKWKTINRLSDKYTDRINDISDERPENGIWIYLKKGYCMEGSDGRHSVHERTVSEVAKALRHTQECGCRDCTEETEYWNK